ncbi:hypothetical protein QJS04_geneDACA000699 [Acorus gramineus]|uniref:Epidermal patterning factor-like protein n=1 Tax=Acorus gramineus TaxID=55184 RepID=A0AAV9AT90_ACOGR|nr:hypothetical protein QJS04_geneDACA000699 [Acorus gramineus]
MASRDFAVDGLFLKLFMVLLLALFLAVSVAAAGDVAPESTEPLQGEIPAAAATGILKSSRKLIGSSPPTCKGQCGGCVPCNRHLVRGDDGTYFVWRCSCDGTLYIP